MSLIGLILGTACTQNLQTTSVRIGGVDVIAEVADSDMEKAIGLMNRTSLPDGAGMLFVFNDEK